MKPLVTIALAGALFPALYLTGCETSHTETDKRTLSGAHKHEETTTTRNPITGDVSTTRKEETTR